MTTLFKDNLKPELVFRVGVIGHRFLGDRLLAPEREQALNRVIEKLLSIIQLQVNEAQSNPVVGPSYRAAPALCRLVCSVAEGVDLMAGEAALHQHYQLQVPLPFSRVDYFKTFQTPLGVRRAEAVIANASHVLELPNSTAEPRAFQSAADLVLAQSDLLLAVWDGKSGHGAGGTEDSLRRALDEFTLPVLLIKIGETDQIFQIRSQREFRSLADFQLEDDQAIAAAVRRIVLLVLSPPLTTVTPPRLSLWTSFWENFALRNERKANLQATTFLTYLDDTPPNRNFFVRLWNEIKALRSLVPTPDTHDARPVENLPPDDTIALLGAHYEKADQLAVSYSSMQRGAVVSTILLGVIATLVMGTADTFGDVLGTAGRGVLVTLYVLMLFGLAGLIGSTRNNSWNERWIDYRLLAESLRQARVVAPLGSIRILPQVPPFNIYIGRPAETWMAWLTRALVRQIGLPNMPHTRHTYSRLKETIRRELILSQINYHTKRGDLLGELSRNLQTTGGWMLVCTLALNVFFVFTKIDAPKVKFISGLIAAVGTALLALSNLPDFSRSQKRAAAMKLSLERYNQAFTLDLDPIALRELLSKLSSLLIRETADWRVLFTDRPPEFVESDNVN